jgi:hypothetical protein
MDQIELCWQCAAAADKYQDASEAAMLAAAEADGLADLLGVLDEGSTLKIPAEQVPEYQRLWEEQHAECDRLSLEANLALRFLLQMRQHIWRV